MRELQQMSIRRAVAMKSLANVEGPPRVLEHPRRASVRILRAAEIRSAVANAAMGCAVMVDKAGSSNFNRKLVYPR
jgi:hypothetical protein